MTRMHRAGGLLVTTLATAAAVGLGVTPAQAAPVQHTTAAAQVAAAGCSTGNRQSVGRSTTWPGSDNWSTSAYGPGTLTLNKAVSVANSFSASVTVDAQVVSATVGFDVTWTDSTNAMFSTPVGDGEHKRIDAGYDSYEYLYDIYDCSGNVIGSGTASEYIGLTYRVVTV